ncbi:hypothetical protein mRhiFer1_007986 [Rhinolophus ferrumequinum]|uniref:Uncharacterized protein n=1 Tax=Rhinolophus ferrumequinum TaxID=59479 RepID=A0A7J8AWC1_RHIFE|nr:hypothetical protein mRhiFer1_007986 [Rhinolophus ferrumequinum]
MTADPGDKSACLCGTLTWRPGVLRQPRPHMRVETLGSWGRAVPPRGAVAAAGLGPGRVQVDTPAPEASDSRPDKNTAADAPKAVQVPHLRRILSEQKPVPLRCGRRPRRGTSPNASAGRPDSRAAGALARLAQLPGSAGRVGTCALDHL